MDRLDEAGEIFQTMTNEREQQAKRKASRTKEAEKNDAKRFRKAMAQYEGGFQQSVDSTNERTMADYGDDAAPPAVGPNYKVKRRQKSQRGH